MDVKSAFLNGLIYEEVYIKQPIGLRILSTHILYLNSINISMDSNKLQELGMRD